MNHPLRALLGTLFVSLCILVAACATTTTTPSPTPSPPRRRALRRPRRLPRARPRRRRRLSAGGGACTPDDLALTGGSWGAAAGSRGAEVSVENRGSAACTLPAAPSVALLDAAGTAIIESPPPTDEPGPTLEPGGVTTFAILFSNWCDEGTALPLRVVLRSGSAGIPIPGLDYDRRRCPAVQRPGAASLAIGKPVAAGRGLIAAA